MTAILVAVMFAAGALCVNAQTNVPAANATQALGTSTGRYEGVAVDQADIQQPPPKPILTLAADAMYTSGKYGTTNSQTELLYFPV